MKKNTNNVVVLDYSTMEVIFVNNVPDEIAEDGDIMEKLGFHESECAWMIGGEVSFKSVDYNNLENND